MKETILNKLKLFFIPYEDNQYCPRFLNSSFLFYYAVVLLILKLIIVPFLFYLPKTVFYADLTKISLIELTNTTRQNLGYQPLVENKTLNQAAYLKAKDMIEKGYFDHYSPEGVTPWYWLETTGYSYTAAGENLAVGFLESEEVHTAWMNSPSHQENILNPNYQEIGIAVVKGRFQGSETSLVVQFFGNPKVVQPPVVTPVVPEIVEEDVVEEVLPEIEEEIIEDIPFEFAEGTLVEPIVKGEEYEEIITKASEDSIKKTPLFVLFHFMVSHYYDLIQIVIYVSLALIILLFFITIFYDIFVYRRFKIDHKGIVLKSLLFSILWVTLLFLDKTIMVSLINSQHLLIF